MRISRLYPRLSYLNIKPLFSWNCHQKTVHVLLPHTYSTIKGHLHIYQRRYSCSLTSCPSLLSLDVCPANPLEKVKSGQTQHLPNILQRSVKEFVRLILFPWEPKSQNRLCTWYLKKVDGCICLYALYSHQTIFSVCILTLSFTPSFVKHKRDI